MKKVLRALKHIWVINFIRRMMVATRYYNKRYPQILAWGFSSNEHTNFTYDLKEDNMVYLAQTISFVTKKDFKEIFNYINEANSDINLKKHISDATMASDERKFADKEVKFGKRLGWYAFVRALKPKLVIETGVDKGLGSVLLCAALEKNKAEGFEGKFYGTDINPEAGYLLSGKYSVYGKILYGDSIETLRGIKETVDLFINDSDHSAEYEYNEYETIKHRLTEKSIILGDNSHVTNKLSKFSLENNRNFVFFKEDPLNHWYPGGGIGISYL